MTALLLALITSSAPDAGLEIGSIVAVPPHLGVVLSASEQPGVALFLAWVLKLTPDGDGGFLRPSQVVIEPGVVFRATASFTARLALRWLRSPLSWLALGGGLGMGIEVSAAVREVSSLELVARLGKGPIGFAMVTARFELRMDATTAWMFALGGTYW